jgi:gliding motility-associated protein GldC
MKRKSEINITVSLDENNVPEKIHWSASDTEEKPSSAKSLLLSFWDEKEQNTMRIDLWTKEMYVEEMKQFFHQNLVTMADTFERATGEAKVANAMRDFADFFAEELKIDQPEA